MFFLFMLILYIIVCLKNTLQDNVTLEKLNLNGNWIEGEGGEAIARMLEENEYITELVRIVPINKILLKCNHFHNIIKQQKETEM